MGLSSLHLDAFVAVAKTQSFSQAANDLFITQSALSQRIKNLEEDLSLTLFLRTPGGAVLTEHGQRLLRYCQTKSSLEEELLEELVSRQGHELAGRVRIGAYSSVLRSVVIPALTPLLKSHPKLLCEFQRAQMEELPSQLSRGEVDFIILDHALSKSNLETHILGQEKIVYIESKNKPEERGYIFLDNNSYDLATENFFKVQRTKAPKYKRAYFDDCYGIIDGVRAGLGRAVMSEHLVRNERSIEIINRYKPLILDVHLYYHRQSFYSKTHQAITEGLINGAKNYL